MSSGISGGGSFLNTVGKPTVPPANGATRSYFLLACGRVIWCRKVELDWHCRASRTVAHQVGMLSHGLLCCLGLGSSFSTVGEPTVPHANGDSRRADGVTRSHFLLVCGRVIWCRKVEQDWHCRASRTVAHRRGIGGLFGRFFCQFPVRGAHPELHSGQPGFCDRDQLG